MPAFTAPDGTELAYHLLGEGEPLLCLPGGPMRASAYLGDLGGLSRHRRLVMLDLRGTGESAVPADQESYRCDRQVEDVEALREHLALERVDVLTHSAGGDLAILHAARHPQRVRSLTLVTPGARPLGVEVTDEHRREALELRKSEPWYESAREALRAVQAGTAGDADWAALRPLIYGRWDAAAKEHDAAGAQQRNTAAAGVYWSSSEFDVEATREAVAALEARVLILAAEFDSGPPPQLAAEIAKRFPAAQLAVQPGAGHFPWLNDPSRFAGTVARFLAGESAG